MRQILLEKSLVTLAVFSCAGVGMLTTFLISIAPGKVSPFWPNKYCTKRCIYSSYPEDTGYIDTMAKT